MRPMHGSYLQVARSEDAIYVCVTGHGNMVNSTTFKDFVDDMLRRGYRAFILDLKACSGLDSTFMGLIAGIAQFEEKARTQVMVVNPPDHCRRLLEDIGLANFINIRDEEFELPALEMEVLEQIELDPKERIRLIQNAHKNLVDIDNRNEKKFGAFLKMLTRELEREDNPN